MNAVSTCRTAPPPEGAAFPDIPHPAAGRGAMERPARVHSIESSRPANYRGSRSQLLLTVETRFNCYMHL